MSSPHDTARRARTSAGTPTDLPRLLLLTDRSQLSLGRSLLRTVRECVDAGLAAVVVREHDLTPAGRSALIGALARIDGLTVISSRHPEPAAAGVHLGADASGNAALLGLPDRSSGQVTTSTQRYPVTGRSCHSADEVRRAAREGASYVTLSPFAESPSKPGYGPPLDASEFGGHQLPVYALGGIHPGNVAAAVAAGAAGVAVMGAVMRAEEPAAVVAALLRELR